MSPTLTFNDNTAAGAAAADGGDEEDDLEPMMSPDDVDDVEFPIRTRKELLDFNNALLRGKAQLTIPLVRYTLLFLDKHDMLL